jgi:uncharacterized protein YacL
MQNPYRAKVIKELVRGLENESRYLRKYSLLGKSLGTIGGLLFGLLLMSALRLNDQNLLWFLCLGTTSGILIGLSVYFGTSVKQWPVVKEFIEANKLQEAAKHESL